MEILNICNKTRVQSSVQLQLWYRVQTSDVSEVKYDGSAEAEVSFSENAEAEVLVSISAEAEDIFYISTVSIKNS